MKRKLEIIWAFLFIIYAAVFYYLAAGLRPARGPDVGGAFYPRILIYVTVILSFRLLYTGIKNKEKEKEALFEVKDGGMIKVLKVIISSFIYLLLLEAVGFLLLTPIYLFILLTIIEAKNFVYRMGISILTTAAVMYIFQNFLNVPFPRGFLG